MSAWAMVVGVKEIVDLIVLQYYAWGLLLNWMWRVAVGEKEESRGMSKREFSEMNSNLIFLVKEISCKLYFRRCN